MKKLRVLVLMHEDLVPPASIEGLSEKQFQPFRTEWHVIQGLRSLGHEIRELGVHDDLRPLREAIEIQRVRGGHHTVREAVAIVVPLCTELAALHAEGRRFLDEAVCGGDKATSAVLKGIGDEGAVSL